MDPVEERGAPFKRIVDWESNFPVLPGHPPDEVLLHREMKTGTLKGRILICNIYRG